MDETPHDDISALLDSATSQADRTRKNAIKQLRSTATKLKNQHDDSPDIVRDSVAHMAENLYAIADYLDTLEVDKALQLPVQAEDAATSTDDPRAIQRAATPPPTIDIPTGQQAALPMEDGPAASSALSERDQPLVMGISFLVGMVVGLLLRRS